MSKHRKPKLAKTRRCKACKGEGWITFVVKNVGAVRSDRCKVCKGTGEVPKW